MRHDYFVCDNCGIRMITGDINQRHEIRISLDLKNSKGIGIKSPVINNPRSRVIKDFCIKCVKSGWEHLKDKHPNKRGS